ncbi:hypothetical protein EGW08_005228 [Elysia chlorotica]|uniref:Uncharacterized protein n=1 Tax=Elysia chlorotica TaxID=188477 RepID=A0A433TZL1_ELYCH|nr:hypothetical protein EGW08_005228 [Elysia chlorotica]
MCQCLQRGLSASELWGLTWARPGRKGQERVMFADSAGEAIQRRLKLCDPRHNVLAFAASRSVSLSLAMSRPLSRSFEAMNGPRPDEAPSRPPPATQSQACLGRIKNNAVNNIYSGDKVAQAIESRPALQTARSSSPALVAASLPWVSGVTITVDTTQRARTPHAIETGELPWLPSVSLRVPSLWTRDNSGQSGNNGLRSGNTRDTAASHRSVVERWPHKLKGNAVILSIIGSNSRAST